MLTVSQALERAVKVAEEARQEWDVCPAGMRAGKILVALSGRLPGYRADIDEIHDALARSNAADRGRHPNPITDAAERAVLGL